MTTTTPSVWEVLSKIDVSEHTEKKGNLTYLSWAWAWGTLKEHYPNASFRKHFFDDLPYTMDDQGYAYVSVAVTVEGNEIIETLPVMNNRNVSIKSPNSFDINSSLQRCLTKAIAYHGLGHYIYAGEDLPMTDATSKEKGKTTLNAKTNLPKELPLTEEQEERAAIIEYEAGETREVAEKKAREDPGYTYNNDKSLADWRESFLDHPHNVAAKTEKGVIISPPSSSEGWELVGKAFAVFMPHIEDVPSSEDCVKSLNAFWKENKDVLTKMSKAEPTLHEQVMNNFKVAKKAALAGEMPQLT